jgi:hypothetical protein
MAMTDKEKGLLDQLSDVLSSASEGAVFGGQFINEIKGIMDGIKGLGIGSRGLDTPAERQYLKGVMDTTSDTTMGSDVFPMIKTLGIGDRGLDTPAEREYLNQFDFQPYTSQFPQGYDQMINQGYDSWSPSDGIPGEGNPHIGEPISNLGLPDTASYQPGSNWGGGQYNYQKNVYPMEIIDLMINQKAIDPKVDQIIPRPDIGENQYEVKLAQTENTNWNDHLQMFMGQDYLRSPSMGGDEFKDNIMGGSKQWNSLRPKPYRDAPVRLDFNTYS